MQSCGFGEVDRSTKRHALANIMSNIQERPFVTTAFDGGITHHPKVLVMIDLVRNLVRSVRRQNVQIIKRGLKSDQRVLLVAFKRLTFRRESSHLP
jgi:Tfp pilus assembly pilus retraction ATPase PilT